MSPRLSSLLCSLPRVPARVDLTFGKMEVKGYLSHIEMRVIFRQGNVLFYPDLFNSCLRYFLNLLLS